VVIGFAGPGRHLQLSSISKSLRDHYAATKFELKTSPRIMCETTSLCQWAREQGCPWDETLCAAAAAGGHLETLKWARGDSTACAAAAGSAQSVHQNPSVDLGAGVDSAIAASADTSTPLSDRICPWDVATTAAAAGGSHLEMLQWASNSGCLVDDTACWAAALGGHIPVLRWLHQQTPRCDWAGWNKAAVAAAVTATTHGSDEDEDLHHRHKQHMVMVRRYAVKKAPGVGGKCAAVIAVMRANIGDTELQGWGMRNVYRLAGHHPDAFAAFSASESEALVAGMKTHPSAINVQAYGMAAIARLACDTSRNRDVLGAVGACEAVAAGLRAHVSQAKVQVSGANAVGQLASNHSINRARLRRAGACEAVVAGMAAHTPDSGVQCNGSAAM
jgi:hypothetical protein